MSEDIGIVEKISARPWPAAKENAPVAAEAEGKAKTTDEILQPAQKIGNTDFMRAVFGEIEPAQHLWVCSFATSPEKADWTGRPQRISEGDRVVLDANHNTYYSVSVLKNSKRRKENFVRMAVLVGDDPKEWSLPPSYVLQTSPGKSQVGYFLHDTPETRDVEQCDRAIKAMVKSGLVDKSGNSVVRYVRLPSGTNTKARETGPFRHVLTEWHPERRYALDEALAGFGVSLTAEVPEQPPQPEASDGDKFNLGKAFAGILDGTVLHDGITRIPAYLASRGVPMEVAGYLLHSLVEHSPARCNDERWNGRIKDINRSITTAYAKFAGEFNSQSDTSLAPLDIFSSMASAPAWFPDDYPAVIRNLAEDVATRLGADPLIPAWIAIATAGALIHDRHKLQVKANDTRWLESARLWVAYVADPSAKKSPALKEVMGAVRKMQGEWLREYSDARKIWEVKAAQARKDKQPEPEPPRARRVMVNDITVESLADVLEFNTGGVLCEKDELLGWFNSMDAYRSTGVSKDRAKYLSAYNGDPEIIDRAGKCPRHIPNFSVSIIGGIQPEPMREIAQRLDEDGLLQRFICIPARSATAGMDVAPNAAAHAEWEALVGYLADLWAHDVTRLSPEAQQVIDEARARIHVLGQHPGFDSRLRTALQKGEGQLARLALIFHFIEDTSGEGDLVDPAPGLFVSVETARKAVRAYMNLIVPSAIAFYREIVGASQGMHNARKVAGYILAHRRAEVTKRELYRAFNEFRGENGERELEEAMQQLELAAWVGVKPKKHGQEPTEWRVNPRVHIEFAEKGDEERARREQIKASIQKAAKLSDLSLARAKGQTQ